MAKLYVRGTLKITESPAPFQDENGQEVVYFKNYFKTEDGELLELNSKDNYELFEGKTGTATLNARLQQNSKLFKLSMASFEEGEEQEEDEIN